MRTLSILGSTGSIGTQTLDIVRRFPERLNVACLTAHGNVNLLVQQAREFSPDLVVIAREDCYDELKSRLSDVDVEVACGEQALLEAAGRPDVDTVVTAVVGAAGLLPTLAAVRAGKRIALANKETMVVAGDLIRDEVARSGAEIVPVDSEHSAIYQCLVGESAEHVERLILTASGGPFLDADADTLRNVTPAQALDHPNWSMGAKITVDSATMMNKGLEVIEARWLFDLPPDRIDVVIHPPSIIHSMVAFIDGSTKAQLGPPSMLVPIQYALSYPERWPADHDRIDWSMPPDLPFQAPDYERFPCLKLAYEALRTGGDAPAVLNAANEVAVQCFLNGEIGFTDIPSVVDDTLNRHGSASGATVEERSEADREARTLAQAAAKELRV